MARRSSLPGKQSSGRRRRRRKVGRVARNYDVESAVAAAIETVDHCLAGKPPKVLPPPKLRHAADDQLKHRSGSVRLASLCLAYYSLSDASWNYDSVPTGIRGQYGDKRLSDAFSSRELTLHNHITAFGENLGWKGNVSRFRLSTDDRFAAFIDVLAEADDRHRRAVADYMASRFADSQAQYNVLPPLGEDVLTFARARALFELCLALNTEGHVQQFVVAALLRIHRRRYGLRVETHHPHAADKFDKSAGDVEEFRDRDLLRAYEVTVRSDWKNRLSDFKAKMDYFGLTKYVIFASEVNNDEELREPANLLTFVEPYGRDIAIVDLRDFVTVMCAELTAEELRESLNEAYSMLRNPKLCGRTTFVDDFVNATEVWLDSFVETTTEGQ